jgi:UMF1 family MFS transporter
MEKNKSIHTADKRTIRGWLFYDWANSVYPLIISSAIFPIMYETLTSIKDEDGKTIYDTISFFGWTMKNTAFYAYLVGVSYIFVALITPLLSGIADFTGKKKRFLQFFCILGAGSASLLFFFKPSNGGVDFTPFHIGWDILPLFFASIGFWGSLVYYNSYLPEIAHPDDHNAISARGFSMGYLGSSILLIIILILTQFTKLMPIHYAFPLVGIWWIGFATYTFVRLPHVEPVRKENTSIVKAGFHELKSVWKDIQSRLILRRYIWSYFLFNMAVQTVMIMATAFANKEIVGIKTQDLIVSILLIQFLGILGSFVFSKLATKYGNRNGLIGAITVWIGLCLFVYFCVFLPWQFYIAAAIVGLVMGGIQALARSTYSKLLPETNDHASYFSFFDVSEKIGLAIGTISFGIIETVTDIRTAVLALVVFFVLGLLQLLRVPMK